MRSTGILLPVFSLPSDYGIGGFGRSAYEFVDYLSMCGQSYWQLLPLGQTSYGDSPYQSPSAFAGNPYFIDPETLCDKGYVPKEALLSLTPASGSIDYGRLYRERNDFLRRAYLGFLENIPADYYEFLRREEEWLTPYALFMVLKDRQGGGTFLDFDEETLKRENYDVLCREYSREMDYYRFLQYEFSAEWDALHAYARSRGIKIIGDIPIYVSADSVDVWSCPEQFVLDAELRPKFIAGVPPDDFAADGQVWGNPLYDWEYMKRDGYSWWCRRMKRSLALYDKVRIDHFVGFSNYYSIPAGDETAARGEILPGPGYEFFATLREKLGRMDIIAEDLGMLRGGVDELLEATGFPGMRVLEFSFSGEDNPHDPKNYPKNCVAYTGTHDNPPFMGFWLKIPLERRRSLSRRFPRGYPHVCDRAVAYVMESEADTVIIPMQDYLRLGDEGRINAPAVLSDKNWSWVLPDDYARASVARRIINITDASGRRR